MVNREICFYEFHVHVTVHRNKFLFNKTNRRANFQNLFLSRNSACFGQFLCSSSGVFPLYNRHWYMSCRFDDSFQARPGRAWKLSSNLHDIYQCRMYSGKTPDDEQRNCPKHAEFLDKNKFWKLARLLVLLKRKMFLRIDVADNYTLL